MVLSKPILLPYTLDTSCGIRPAFLSLYFIFYADTYTYIYTYMYVCVSPEYVHLFVLYCNILKFCILMCISSTVIGKTPCVYARTLGELCMESVEQVLFEGH